MNINLSGLALPSLEEITVLDAAGIPLQYSQRKNYDEYYIHVTEVQSTLGVDELLSLSEFFRVEIIRGTIYLNSFA